MSLVPSFIAMNTLNSSNTRNTDGDMAQTEHPSFSIYEVRLDRYDGEDETRVLPSEVSNERLHHEIDSQKYKIFVRTDLFRKLSVDLLTKGITCDNLTSIVCACLFRNHIFKRMLRTRSTDLDRYESDCFIFNHVCKIDRICADSSVMTRFFVRLNDFVFPSGSFTKSDWRSIKKRIKMSNFDVAILWTERNECETDYSKDPLRDVYMSKKCRKLITRRYSENEIKKYFESLSEKEMTKKKFYIALDGWVNFCDGSDNASLLAGKRLSNVSFGSMCEGLNQLSNNECVFRPNMTRQLAFNSDDYNLTEREVLNRWLINPINSSPSMAVTIAIIQSVGSGKWDDFYHKK